MAVCAVADCKNSTEDDQTPKACFFQFPLDQSLLEKWLFFCARKDGLNIKTARICSLHFTKDDFENFMKFEMGFASKLKLKKDAVPTVHVVRKSPSPIKNATAVRQAFESLTKEVDSMKKKIADLQRENFILKTAEEDYKKHIKKLQTELTKSEYVKNNTEEKLREVFSVEQIRRLKNARRVHWSERDIQNAIQLYSTSSRAYKLLMKWQYPLPAVRTLLVHQKRMLEEMDYTTAAEGDIIKEEMGDEMVEDVIEEINEDDIET